MRSCPASAAAAAVAHAAPRGGRRRRGAGQRRVELGERGVEPRVLADERRSARGSHGRAQRRTRRGSTAPFHSLSSSVNVASTGPSASHGSLPGGAERDRAGAHAAGLDGEAHVLVLAHRPRVGQPRGGDEQRARPGCPCRTARAAASSSASVEAELVAGDDGVDALDRLREVLGVSARVGVRAERGAERVELVARDLQAGGGAVAAVAQQVLGAGVQAAEQVEARRRCGPSRCRVSPSSAMSTAGRW